MNPFYKLNQTLANIGKEHDQIAESVEKAKAEVKSPARKTLEESLRSDMKSLMEGSPKKVPDLPIDKKGIEKNYGGSVVKMGQAAKAAGFSDSRIKQTGEKFLKGKVKEGQADDVYVQHPDGKQEKVKWAPGMVAQHKDGRQEKVPHPSKMVHKPKKVSEDGTGGMNFSGSGSLEEKAGYSAKKAAAGKDIGKPGKNFAKIEKSAGGGEKGKKIAGAVLAKLRAAKESVEEASEEMAVESRHPENFDFPADGRYGYAMGGGGVPYGTAGFRSDGLNIYDKVSKKIVSIPDFTYFDQEPDQEELKYWFYNPEGEPMDEAGAGGIHGRMPDPMTAKDQQRKMNPPRSLEETDSEIMEFLRSKLGHAEAHPYNAGTGRPDAHNGMEFEGNAFTGKLANTPKGGEFELDGEEFTDTSSLEETVSRKHFQQVADLLRNIPDEAKRKEMALHHASIFAKQNPRFDMRRFGQAAGVDLEECAMWEELKGGQVKLDKNHDGKLSAQDFAVLRGEEEVDEGFADMDAWLAQREKEKGTGRFDSRKVSTGTVYTRKPETFDDPETDPEATGGAPKRGRGRPAVAKKPERVTGKAWKHKGGRVQEEGEEMVDEKAEQGKRHFFDKLAPAAKKVAKVVAKVTGEKKTEKEDSKAEKAGKKVAKDIEHDEGHKAKGDDKAEKAGKKVTKDIEYDDKKDKKEKKADKKEEKVDETTTSGSVATASTSKKSSGMGIGQGIYDSWEREFETLLAESVSVTQEATMDENAVEGSEESITITATGDDVAKLKQALMAMGISHTAPAAEPHSEEPCHSCGGVPCQCDDVSADAGLPGEMEIAMVEDSNEVDYSEDDDGNPTWTYNGHTFKLNGDYQQGEGFLDNKFCCTYETSEGGTRKFYDEAGKTVIITSVDDDKKIGEFVKSKFGDTVQEADAPVSQNDPDYPTNQECSDDALQYSGGLNKPKATGQATTPILASQTDRQVAESNSFYSLVKAVLVK